MMRHSGGERVGKGTYWNFGNGERVDISSEGVLPGGRDARYYRISAFGILVVAPVMGLLYAIFLPFIGIAMLAKMILQKAGGGAWDTLASSATFGWRPSEAYLAGKKREGKDKEPRAEHKEEAPPKDEH